MPQRVTITALKDQTYDGQPIRRGQTFDVLPLEAVLLHRRGLISLARVDPKVQTRDVQAEPESDQPRRKRHYRRRDLTADSS